MVHFIYTREYLPEDRLVDTGCNLAGQPFKRQFLMSPDRPSHCNLLEGDIEVRRGSHLVGRIAVDHIAVVDHIVAGHPRSIQSSTS